MTKNGSGATFNFNGKVEVKGDMLGGDKVVHNYGDNIVNIQTPPQFISALQDLRGEITALKEEAGISPAQKSELEIVEAQIIEVEQKAEEDAPDGEEIRKTLGDAKKTIDSIAGAITSAVGLGALLGQLAYMATQVFGG